MSKQLYTNKNIAIVPPNGEFVGQDFAINRITDFFKDLNIKVTLLCITNNSSINSLYIKNIKEFKSTDDIIKHLRKTEYDIIFSRSWMHRYSLGAKLAEEFDNVVSYIKDWHNYPKKYYTFVFNTTEDVQAIKSIFKNSKIILSHYTKEYTNKLAKKYNINENKFYFFPEYTNKKNFCERKNFNYNLKNLKILAAGGIVTTSHPNIMVPGKAYFLCIQQIISNKIKVHSVIIPKAYNKVFSNALLFQDYLFEHNFNKYYSIKKGIALNSELGEKYHFGLFFLGTCLSDDTYYIEAESYAITSKLAFYMECGLPILVNERFKSISKIVKDNGIGLVLTDQDLNNLNNKLDISNVEYNLLVKNVYKFRKKFTYNKKTMKPILNLLK